MNPAAKSFRNVLAQLCQTRSENLRDILADFDVDEALEQADDAGLGARKLAARVLWQCCCTDGKFNNASIVFLAVMMFLKERLGTIETQAFTDLAKMLKAGTTQEAIRKWVETHYP